MVPLEELRYYGRLARPTYEIWLPVIALKSLVKQFSMRITGTLMSSVQRNGLSALAVHMTSITITIC